MCAYYYYYYHYYYYYYYYYYFQNSGTPNDDFPTFKAVQSTFDL